MRINLKNLAIGAMLFVPVTAVSQTLLSKDSVRTVSFKNQLQVVQNYNFIMYGSDEHNSLYAINGYKFPFFSPKKWTIAPMIGGDLLYYDGKNVKLHDVFSNEDAATGTLFKSKKVPVNLLSYSPDGRYILVVTSDGILRRCTTDAGVKTEKRIQYELKLSAIPQKVLINKNANAGLLFGDNKLDVVNLERGAIRKTLEFPEKVCDIAYSDDCRQCVVLLKDGSLRVLDVATLKEKKNIKISGGVMRCQFMVQGKYVVVATANAFQFVNLLTEKIDYRLSAENNLILGMDLFKDTFNIEQLLYYYGNKLNVLNLQDIDRYHAIDLKHELDLRMDEWSKMLPGESEADYLARVNDESRAKYALELERQLVTEMAGDLLDSSKPRFGNYIDSNQALAIDFEGMPSIYLNIPSNDLKDFKTIDDLEFMNTVYGLTADDKYEIIYTEARNKTTGKTYVFDNLNRKSIAFDEDDFVPMEVVQLASIEAAKLEKIKEEVMEQAKKDEMLTDHTRIMVSTEPQRDVDADGNKIINYKIDYMYEVEEEYSARDDFKAGKYNTAESKAAVQMMSIIKSSLQGDFAKYTVDSKRLEVSVTGSADAVPIVGTLAYKGEYGNLVDKPVYQDGELSIISVTKKGGIKSNEQLAFVRAMGVSDYMNKNVINDITMPIDYKYNVEVPKEKGSKYRRIKVSLKFIDAFRDK